MRYGKTIFSTKTRNSPSAKGTHAHSKLALPIIFTPYTRTLSVVSPHQSTQKMWPVQKSAHDYHPSCCAPSQQIVRQPSFPKDTWVRAAMLLCWQRAPQPHPMEAMKQMRRRVFLPTSNKKKRMHTTPPSSYSATRNGCSQDTESAEPLTFLFFSFALHFLDLPPSLLDGPWCQEGSCRLPPAHALNFFIAHWVQHTPTARSFSSEVAYSRGRTFR